jgi:small-conductance mechanosensitive channel
MWLLVIMCGFINPILNNLKNEIKTEVSNPNSNDNIVENKEDDHANEKLSKTDETNNLENVANTEPSSNKLINKNKKTTFSVSKFLSYFLVFLITFIALIIVLDTFKTPLSSIIPGLEIFLYNFFETLKDLYLFLKNLLS